MIIKQLIVKPDGTQEIKEITVPDDFYDNSEPETEPTTDEILDALLGVTADE